jgi:hypothetical protein
MALDAEGKESLEEGQVAVSKETLEQMLSDMADLKEKNMNLIEKVEGKEAKDEAEKLAQRTEFERQAKSQQGEFDVEKLSKKEFFAAAVQTALSTVREEIAQPLLNMVMTVVVDREVEKVSKNHGQDKEPEGFRFDDLKDDVFELASKNDKLTIEQAFNLAKSNKMEMKSKEDIKKQEKVNVDKGEKPGASRTTIEKGGKLSIREAAEKARGELYKSIK